MDYGKKVVVAFLDVVAQLLRKVVRVMVARLLHGRATYRAQLFLSCFKMLLESVPGLVVAGKRLPVAERALEIARVSNDGEANVEDLRGRVLDLCCLGHFFSFSIGLNRSIIGSAG